MKNKVAIVSGASSGIGLDISRTLLAQGYSVVGVSRSASRRGTLVPSSKLTVLEGDVASRETAVAAVQVALSRFDRLDLLVNNAGLFIAKPFIEYSAEDYSALLATNLAGFFHLTQAALPHFIGRRSGHVVNIGTSLASQPVAGVTAALPILLKGGIEAATRALAIEYAPQHIRINTVSAGAIDTPMHPKESHAFLRGLSPAQRLGTVEEISAAVLYLDAAEFVSGEVLHVDGGAHAGRW